MTPDHQKPLWVTDNESLSHYCQQWHSLDAIALDTEFVRTDTFYPLPGLIQLGTGTDIFLIDPMTIDQWEPFREILESNTLVKVLHACSEDLEVFSILTGASPKALFDTQLAAAFSGLGFSLGYQSLLNKLMNIDLPKDETRSNWRQRPLTDAQVRYAALDVVHLLDVYKLLTQELTGKPQLQWLLEDCSAMTTNTNATTPDTAWKEVKRAWQLNPQQLAVLKALCEYRELESRKLDVPRNRVIPKGSLWSLARYQPKNARALQDIPDLRHSVTNKHGDNLLSIIRSSSATAQKNHPEVLPGPLPKSARDFGKQVKLIINKQAESLELPVELLLSGKMTTPILRIWLETGQFELPDSLKGWRRTIIGQPLIEQLNKQLETPQ